MKYIYQLFVILVSCTLLSGCIDDYHVLSFYGWSSGPDTEPWIRGMNPTLIEQGWRASLNTPGFNDQKTITQREKDFGSEGILIHLPFGRNAGQDFDFAGYSTSLKDPRLSKVVDVQEFISAWVEFAEITQYKKIIFYYGYVGADVLTWANLPEAEVKALILKNIEPVRLLSEALKPLNVKTGIVIDVASQMTDLNNPNLKYAIPYIQSLGLLYGGEPWLNLGNPFISDANYLSVFDMRSTWLFDPDFDTTHGTWNTWSAPRAKIKGSIMSIALREWANNNYNEPVESFREKTVYSLKKFKNICIPPPDDPDMTANKLKTLAVADGTSCMTQHGITNCCTSVKENLTCTHVP